jgi:DNA-binding HxlR family transcriptional regulator
VSWSATASSCEKIYPQVLPTVEYSLTKWGEAMCPTLDSLLEWAAARPK